jgi:hypothetical protein
MSFFWKPVLCRPGVVQWPSSAWFSALPVALRRPSLLCTRAVGEDERGLRMSFQQEEDLARSTEEIHRDNTGCNWEHKGRATLANAVGICALARLWALDQSCGVCSKWGVHRELCPSFGISKCHGARVCSEQAGEQLGSTAAQNHSCFIFWGLSKWFIWTSFSSALWGWPKD